MFKLRNNLQWCSKHKAVQRWLCRSCGYRFSESKVESSFSEKGSEQNPDGASGSVVGSLGFEPRTPSAPGSAPLRAPKEPIFQEISLNWVAVASVLGCFAQ